MKNKSAKKKKKKKKRRGKREKRNKHKQTKKWYLLRKKIRPGSDAALRRT